MHPLYLIILLFVNPSFVHTGVIPIKPAVPQNSNNHTTDSEEIVSLLDRQMPVDIVYDLAGRMKLITQDETTDAYNTFMVNRDQRGIPYILDPQTGRKYVVKHSRVSRGIELYQVAMDKTGKPVVHDYATMTVNRIKVNKHGEVELIPVDTFT